MSVDGVFATADGPDGEGDWSVNISGEMQGPAVDDDAPTLVCAIYDGAGRVVGTAEHWMSDFAGFDTFDVSDYAKSLPVKGRIFVRG